MVNIIHILSNGLLSNEGSMVSSLDFRILYFLKSAHFVPKIDMIGVLRGINKTAIQVKYFSVNNFCQFNTQATARRGWRDQAGPPTVPRVRSGGHRAPGTFKPLHHCSKEGLGTRILHIQNGDWSSKENVPDPYLH